MTPDVNVVISHSEYTVLVVDDVVSNVLLLKVLLTNEKFKVITAGNGKEALSQAVNARPDLILLDVMMPEMNGFEVAERLKADPETQHIPIIFLTALNTTADIVKGFKVGANDFISKPFNKEELVIRVTHQISLIAAKRIIMKQTEELRKIIMGRDKLYSVIAHDLRSPMGSIKMVLNMLILSLPSEQIGKEMFDMLSMANQSTMGHRTKRFFSMIGGNGRKALITKGFRCGRGNGLNISKRFFPLHGLTSALRLRGFSSDLRVIALHRACRWG